MKKVFVDTNILIVLLADRPPFSKFGIEIFDLAERNKAKLFTSSHSFATTHYLPKKNIGGERFTSSIAFPIRLYRSCGY